MINTGIFQQDTKKSKSTAKRQEWMKTFEQCALEYRPELAGKIEWNAAIYNYSLGLTPADAAHNLYHRKVAI